MQVKSNNISNNLSFNFKWICRANKILTLHANFRYYDLSQSITVYKSNRKNYINAHLEYEYLKMPRVRYISYTFCNCK